MSEEVKGDDVALDVTSDAGDQESSQKSSDAGQEAKSVKFETYDRVIRKLKQRESEYSELQERLKKIEQDRLEADGNKDELISSLRQEVAEHKNRYKVAIGSVALSHGKSAIVDEAVKAGCNSPEILTKLLERELENVDYDDEFRPDRDQIRKMIEAERKKNPILFSKEAPKTANHNINPNAASTMKTKKPIHKMTDQELDALWAQLSTRG